MSDSKPLNVVIVGSGLIGRAWTSLFTSVGHAVTIYDNNSEQLNAVRALVKESLKVYQNDDCLRGNQSIDEQVQLINTVSNLEVAFESHTVDIVIECVFENLDVKAQIFKQLDSLVDEGVILASSSSCIGTSSYCESLHHRSQCLVSHPVNPPYLLRLVEIVPNPWTSPEVIAKCKRIMESIGQKPVVFSKEIPGFAVNRMQYALINQAWDLVQQGILSADDVDKVVTEGLGPRWAFYGPMAVLQLNANGFEDYMSRYKTGMVSVSSTMGQSPDFDDKTTRLVAKKMNELMPLNRLNNVRQQRDKLLGEVFKAKLKHE